MDLSTPPSLRDGMAKQDDQIDNEALIRQIFYLLTARFEDGASIAAEGQAASLALDARIELANRLLSLADEVKILAHAVIALGSDLAVPAA
jgi:hypothetical protein